MSDTTRRDFLKFTATFAVASSLPLTARSETKPRLRQGHLAILSATGVELLSIDLIILERSPRLVRGTGGGIVHVSGTAHVAKWEIDGYPTIYTPIAQFHLPDAMIVNTVQLTAGGSFVLGQFTLTDDRR